MAIVVEVLAVFMVVAMAMLVIAVVGLGSGSGSDGVSLFVCKQYLLSE